MYIDDDYLKHQRHLNQLRRSMYKGNTPESLRYNYIIDRNDLLDSYLRGMNDLGYPLRVEPKRDRYVLNADAFKRAMEEATTRALNEMEKEIINWIQNDVKNMIEDTTQEVLDSINVMGNNLTVTSKGKKPKKTWAEKLGEKFGKALAKSILSIFDDIVKGR